MLETARRSLRALVRLDDSAETVARAFGLGLAVGFSPFLGLQTFIALGILLAVRLNRRAFLLGAFLNVWTMVPVAALGTGLGMFLTGSRAFVPELSREAFTSGRLWAALSEDVSHLLVPFILGNTVIALSVGAAGYWLSKRLLLRYRARARSDTVSIS